MSPKVRYRPVDRDKAEKAVLEIRQWLGTKEGRTSLESVAVSGTPVSDEIAQGRDVDPEEIREQIGPGVLWEDE